MAYYNGGFPVTYQNPYYQQMAQPQIPAQSQTMNSGIIWVQGEAGAKSYLVAPNTTVQLWDSEKQVIYLKSADASGMPSMKILDYKLRESAQNPTLPENPISNLDYVTKAEFEALRGELEQIKHSVSIKETGGTENV